MSCMCGDSQCPSCGSMQGTLDYELVYLAGRCANGAERDRGHVIHAKYPNDWRALCGKGYGRTSGGWADADSTVTEPTCPRCKRAAASATHAQEQK